MKRISYIIVLFLQMAGLRTNAQTTFAAVQTKTGFTRLVNDSVVLTPATGLRGTLQWQSTTDLVTWIEVASNLPGSKLAFKPQTTLTYRLKITEGTCNPIYGDTIKVFARGTTPAAYVQAGVSVTDLVSAGVPSSEILPAIATNDISAITLTSVTCGGNITSGGCTAVTSRGVCWNTTGNPTTSNSITTDGSGTGSFTSYITGLNSGTTYYVSAYATNSVGTSYGEEKTFTTPALSAPVVNTSDVSSITQTTATCGGNVSSAGTSTVTARGVCWNTVSGPTTANSKTSDATGTGIFTSSITGLTANTTYYVRAYATNSTGTSYGAEKTFTTLAYEAPAVNTADVSNISQTSATCGGNVTSAGTLSVTVRGVCWSTTTLPTISNNKTFDDSGTGGFTSSITGLTASTTYYVRAYATSSAGTSYGAEKTFTTLAYIAPAVNTADVSSISQTSVTCGGTVTSAGTLSVTARGVCWSITPSPTISNNKTTDGSGTGSFTSSLSGLTANTTYYLRAYATSLVATSYGTEKTFTTLAHVPAAVNTASVSNIDSTSATCGGNVTSSGTATVTACGVCWNTKGSPTIADSKTTNGSGTGSFTSSLTGLIPDCIYHVRAYATSEAGTVYGSEMTFTTLLAYAAKVMDYDGNAYDTVTIGTQVWLKQNLKVTHYNNGYLIPFYKASTTTNGARYYYSDDSASYAPVYGAMYNFYAVTDNRDLCPAGWYVPSRDDWDNLGNYLGSANSAGGQMKEAGTAHWQSPNTGATNSSGFTALPGGLYGDYNNRPGITGAFWSSTPTTYATEYAWYYTLLYSLNNLYSDGIPFNKGLSVRCIRDHGTLPIVNTSTVTNISSTSATCGGNVISGSYTTTARGVCWNTTGSPTTANSKTTDGSGAGSFTSNITGLNPYTSYHVRAYATYTGGTAYGKEIVFTTVPSVTTADVVFINQTSVTCGGTVASASYGGSTVTARGVCWSTSPSPDTSNNKTTDGSGADSFTSSITGLAAHTTYYVRAYATNPSGTSYGVEKSFATTVEDIDGNSYDVVTIGTQVWMKQNLATTKYNDGTAIPLVTDGNAWGALTTPAYCWYNNDSVTYKNPYGALYNWYTVNTAKLCPTGWHVPADTEWVTLTNYLGGTSKAGGHMKESGTTHWVSPNTGADNSSGFTAVAGGDRATNGIYAYFGSYQFFWSATQYNTTSAKNISMYYFSAGTTSYNYSMLIGYSVRCVK
jgi:uncharacterized protein (TIGR02145 family)